MLALFPILLLLGAGASVFLFARGTAGLRIGWIDNAAALCRFAAARVRFLAAGIEGRGTKRRSYSRSLFRAECFKTLVSSRLWIPVLAILCVKGWYSARINAPVNSYADAVYREYMTTGEKLYLHSLDLNPHEEEGLFCHIFSIDPDGGNFTKLYSHTVSSNAPYTMQVDNGWLYYAQAYYNDDYDPGKGVVTSERNRQICT